MTPDPALIPPSATPDAQPSLAPQPPPVVKPAEGAEGPRRWLARQPTGIRGMLGANVACFAQVMVVIACVSFGRSAAPAGFECFGLLLAAATAGTTIGWLFGAAASPLDRRERERFSGFFKGAAAVMSGAAILKLLDWLGKPAGGDWATGPAVAGACVFAANLATGVITAYGFRTYSREVRNALDAEASAAPAPPNPSAPLPPCSTPPA